MTLRQPALSALGRVRLTGHSSMPFRLAEFHVLSCTRCQVLQAATGVIIIYCVDHDGMALQRARKAGPDVYSDDGSRDQSREAA